MNLLLIETATGVCSAARAEEGRIVALLESMEPNAHSTQLPLFVRELLGGGKIDAVCVSSGPGSYTGLRIGTSTAKGVAYALDVPLLSVPTLQSMAVLYYLRHQDCKGMVCPMIDARRMECYTAFYKQASPASLLSPFTSHLSPTIELRGTQSDVIVDGIYDQWLDSGEVVFVGDGAAKTRDILGKHPNASFDCDFRPSAEGLLKPALERLEKGETEDVAYFEPFYLKDFVAKKSVVHGLRINS